MSSPEIKKYRAGDLVPITVGVLLVGVAIEMVAGDVAAAVSNTMRKILQIPGNMLPSGQEVNLDLK